MHHIEGAIKQVPEIVRQIGVVAFNQTFLGKIRVFTSRDIAHQIITNCVGTVFIREHKRIDDVARAFAHLCATEIPPAVHEQLRHLVVGESDRMQHDQPVDAVRGNEDVFADDL